MATQNRIRAELETPAVVHLPADDPKGTVEIDVLCRLHNDGEDDYVVGATSHEEIHNWHVLDARHREVARQPADEAGPAAHPEGCAPISSQAIIAGHSHNATQRLSLPVKKLKAGGRYRIRYTFWGQLAEADFVVLPSIEELTTPRKKAVRKKKPAKKKAAGKKAATAKPAKKAAPTKKTAKKGGGAVGRLRKAVKSATRRKGS